MSFVKISLNCLWESTKLFRQSTVANGLVNNYIRRSVSSYEGDGKTTVTILNFEMDSPLMINSYHQHGFKLNNGISVIGPIAIFPKTVLGWNVPDVDGITPESLSLFTSLDPKLDILVIGMGDTGSKVPLEAIKYLRQHKINLEILPTEHACATFNFLNVEKRCVAAALIPPRNVRYGQDDITSQNIRRKKLHSAVEDDTF